MRGQAALSCCWLDRNICQIGSSMRTFVITTLACLSGGFAGCTTPIGVSNYQKVAVVSTFPLPNGTTSLNFQYSPPAYFTLTPSDVIATYGDRCRATYNCTYFADNEAYYLLQNYGVVPSFSISTHAVVIVDGRTGKLLKGK